jgi:hypothetical protein
VAYVPGGGGGAPTTADYLVKTADAGLSAERVVTDTTSITVDWATAAQAKIQREALTGDVTAAQNSNATTIAAAAVTLAKMANLAQDLFIGRVTASTGVPETATITAAARTVLDDVTVGAMVDTIGGAAASGTGGLARVNTPVFTTPNIGVATGSVSGSSSSCTGLAATATALATPRAINGVNFDGSAAIEAPDSPNPIVNGTTSKIVSGYQRINVNPTFDGTMTLDGQWVLI